MDFAALFAFCDLHASRVPHDRPRNTVAWYDWEGWRIPDDEHARILELLGLEDFRFVCQDTFADGSRLVTVWNGFDASAGGPPLIFETRYLPVNCGDEDGRFTRDPLPFPDPRTGQLVRILHTPTEEAARAVHAGIVRRLTNG